MRNRKHFRNSDTKTDEMSTVRHWNLVRKTIESSNYRLIDILYLHRLSMFVKMATFLSIEEFSQLRVSLYSWPIVKIFW